MLSSSEEESGIPWQVVTAATTKHHVCESTSNDVPMNEEEIGGSLSDTSQ